MNTCKRLAIAAVMLILINLPLLLLIYWQARQVIVQYEMLEELETSELETVRMRQSQVQWYKKDKELIIDGKLFDVKSYTLQNDIIVCTGLFDEKESELKKKITSLQQQQEEDGTSTKLAAECIFFDAVSHNQQKLLTYPLIAFTGYPGLLNYGKIAIGFLSRLYPPPRIEHYLSYNIYFAMLHGRRQNNAV